MWFFFHIINQTPSSSPKRKGGEGVAQSQNIRLYKMRKQHEKKMEKQKKGFTDSVSNRNKLNSALRYRRCSTDRKVDNRDRYVRFSLECRRASRQLQQKNQEVEEIFRSGRSRSFRRVGGPGWGVGVGGSEVLLAGYPPLGGRSYFFLLLSVAVFHLGLPIGSRTEDNRREDRCWVHRNRHSH